MISREEYIDKYFINLTLSVEHIDLYYVRRSILEAVKSNLGIFQGKILDVGCGIMPYREFIMKLNHNVTDYIGLDFEGSLNEEYNMGKPDLFWQGDVIPMKENSIETVIATEFFEHSSEPEKVMKEILRVLKPGGVIFFTVPFLWNLHVVPFDEYRYTPFAIERLLKSAGFQNIKLKSLGGTDASLAQMIAIWYTARQRALGINSPGRGVLHKNQAARRLLFHIAG